MALQSTPLLDAVINLSIYGSTVYPIIRRCNQSIYLSIYLSIYGSTVPYWTVAVFFRFVIYTQTV
jgi:hypothetical protein